jgi:hypothetical protein
LDGLVVWPTPSLPTRSDQLTSDGLSGLHRGTSVLGSVTAAGAVLSPALVRTSGDDGAETTAAPWSLEWVPPFFALVDPRAPVGAVIFIVLGLGALSLAMAGVPRRAYAGVGLPQESELALRATLACAGLVLLAAAGIGQLAA